MNEYVELCHWSVNRNIIVPLGQHLALNILTLKQIVSKISGNSSRAEPKHLTIQAPLPGSILALDCPGRLVSRLSDLQTFWGSQTWVKEEKGKIWVLLPARASIQYKFLEHIFAEGPCPVVEGTWDTG